MRAPTRASTRSPTTAPVWMACLLAVAAMPVRGDVRADAGIARSGEHVSAPHASAGTRDPAAYFTETELLTQDNRKVRFYSDVLKGRIVVLNVMFASCKDACPLITRQLVDVRSELGELFGSRIFFVSITSDPERDTPAALKRFAREQHAAGAGWTFLTGSRTDVYRVLARLGARPAEADDHITVLYVLDVDNKRMRRVLPNIAPAAIAEAVRSIADAGKRG